MSNEHRMDKIHEFLNEQRYLEGTKCTITEEGNGFLITFEKASERQLITLNRTLHNFEMKHIRATAKEIIKYESKKR